jgi:putative redox protein
MKARVAWTGGRQFVGEAGSHSLVMDGAPEAGGRNSGFRPLELLLVGMCGCTAFDVVHILEKGRHAVEDCSCEATAERATEDPKIFTAIHVNFHVRGRKLSEDAVNRAVELSAEKYCSASIMLGKTAKITHSVTVEDTSQV